MKKVFIVAAFKILCCCTARATDYYVDATSGSDVPGGGSQADPWKTITYALNQVIGVNHTVHMAMGTYDSALGENFPILVKNGVSLVGGGMDVSMIDASGSNESGVKCIGIVDTTTKIEGFSILGGGGLSISAGSVLKIENNKIKM